VLITYFVGYIKQDVSIPIGYPQKLLIKLQKLWIIL
jgi:hypothetical protein